MFHFDHNYYIDVYFTIIFKPLGKILLNVGKSGLNKVHLNFPSICFSDCYGNLFFFIKPYNYFTM